MTLCSQKMHFPGALKISKFNNSVKNRYSIYFLYILELWMEKLWTHGWKERIYSGRKYRSYILCLHLYFLILLYVLDLLCTTPFFYVIFISIKRIHVEQILRINAEQGVYIGYKFENLKYNFFSSSSSSSFFFSTSFFFSSSSFFFSLR